MAICVGVRATQASPYNDCERRFRLASGRRGVASTIWPFPLPIASSSPAAPGSSAALSSKSSTRAATRDVIVPRRREYDLTREARCRAALRRLQARRRAAPGGGGGRDRRQPRQPRPVILRQRGDGHAPDRRGAQERAEEVRAGRDDLRLPESHAGAVQGIGSVERLPGSNQRPLRHRQEGAAGDVPGLSPAVRAERGLSAAGESVRPARQFRPAHHRTSSRP